MDYSNLPFKFVEFRTSSLTYSSEFHYNNIMLVQTVVPDSCYYAESYYKIDSGVCHGVNRIWIEGEILERARLFLEDELEGEYIDVDFGEKAPWD